MKKFLAMILATALLFCTCGSNNEKLFHVVCGNARGEHRAD